MTTYYYIATTIGSLLSYVLYNAAFFTLVSHVLDMRPARWKTNAAACIVNFATFFVGSASEVPLVINWTIVAALFALEIRIIYQARRTDCALGALLGAIIGLAGTLIMRSTCAIVLNMPLSAVNNDVISIKAIPVLLGFLLASVLIRLIDTPHNHRILSTIRNEPRVIVYLLVEVSLCYLYLCLNLLLYYNDLNTLIIKVWSLKTAVFVSLGVVLVIWFAYRTASVFGQARRRATLAREIELDQQANRHLKELADHDSLTGCFTRAYAERTLAELARRDARPTIVFADVDRLKEANDRFGHEAGDAYLIAAAGALDQIRASTNDFVARYGGDEFLVVLAEPLGSAQIAERMNVAASSLRASGRDKEFPFEMRISWGHAIPEENESVADAIARADEAMYRDKRAYR